MKKIDKAINKILDLSLIFLILVMVGMVVWQVVARYILKISTPYAEELARLSIVWCVFIGSAIAVRKDEHIRVTFMVNKFPEYIRLPLFIIGSLSIIALSYIMIYYGIKHVITVWPDHQTTSLGYSRGLFYLPVPTMGALFFIYSVIDVVNYIQALIKHTKKEGEQ